jgi:hypothetical protein
MFQKTASADSTKQNDNPNSAHEE